MTTIANLNSLNEAFMLRSFLAASEIPAFIPDEYTAQAEGGILYAMGGIRVQVADELAEKAQAVVSEFRSH
jgi:hypothetical protein